MRVGYIEKFVHIKTKITDKYIARDIINPDGDIEPVITDAVVKQWSDTVASLAKDLLKLSTAVAYEVLADKVDASDVDVGLERLLRLELNQIENAKGW